MLVALLQMMGFPMAKPVNSRAGDSPSKPSRARDGAAALEDHGQASSARRQEVKTKAGKTPAAKAAKPVPKGAAKPVTKPAAKKAAAAKMAGMTSRINTMLSIPMLMFMQAGAHGIPF